jgi:hypothetical protein
MTILIFKHYILAKYHTILLRFEHELSAPALLRLLWLASEHVLHAWMFILVLFPDLVELLDLRLVGDGHIGNELIHTRGVL